MKWMRIVAVVLALLWGAWWTFFGIASGIGEGMTPAGIIMHAVPGLVFLLIAVLAWLWTLPGGIILLIMGLVVLVGYPIMFSRRFPPNTILIMLLTMALPPLAAGILLLASRRRTK